ncbi:hypothetical protein [Planktothricoides raciborskii]|uniref:Uncharacterized protein n=1 Tax=Planktothricoides raciborskii FACHB-1370 TaxID=2949576 RepID=A0ABR8EN52_9CYAN|nr:hypothetical protein [Planktothricoides raciborskii]MBD2547320.1 hypothetical protein [Planktothricoides raciborskii FACHB-1370]MBD2585208.1 hypothetical protein [Planktothricoides raciborskii FACHB-1261]
MQLIMFTYLSRRASSISSAEGAVPKSAQIPHKERRGWEWLCGNSRAHFWGKLLD